MSEDGGMVMVDIDGDVMEDNVVSGSEDDGADLEMELFQAMGNYALACSEYDAVYGTLDKKTLASLKAIEKRQTAAKDRIKAAALATITPGENQSAYGYVVRVDRPRESVDIAQFKGYCVSHPEAEKMIKVGEPRVVVTKGK